MDKEMICQARGAGWGSWVFTFETGLNIQEIAVTDDRELEIGKSYLVREAGGKCYIPREPHPLLNPSRDLVVGK